MKKIFRYLMWNVAFFVSPIGVMASLPSGDTLSAENRKTADFDSIGNYSLQHNAYDSAARYFQAAVRLKKQKNDTAGLVYSYERLSLALQRAGKFLPAIKNQMLAAELKSEVFSSYYHRVKNLIPKANDSLNLTRLFYRYALFLSNSGKKNQAIDYYLEALKMARDMHYDKAIVVIANDLAGEYWDLGKKQLSTIGYREALAAAKRLNDSNQMAAVYLNIGDNYKEQGQLEEGMKQMVKALQIKEALTDSSHLSFYFIKAAEIAQASRNWKGWKNYIAKAYAIINIDHCASPMEKAIIYNHLGGIAEMEGQDKKALKYYDTLMTISRKIDYINGIKSALDSRAGIYKKLGRPEKALQLLQAADQYATENPFYQIKSRNARAELYLETGHVKKALPLLKQNISSGWLSNYAGEKLRTIKLLYRANVKLNQYREAFRWNDSLQNFENYLRDKEVRMRIAELETKYQTEKSRHTIGLLKAKNEIYNQQIRFAVVMIMVLIIFIALGIFMARLNRMRAEYRENLLKQQLLRSQMNPHFIFNALASIQQMIQEGKTQKASFYLQRFASIARLVLEYSREESIPLDKEIEVLTSYIELEKLRYGDRFRYTLHLPEDLETEFIRIPPMSIQPFVENAIKHGLKDKETGGLLQLFFEDLGDVLKVTIEDNGPGIYQMRQQLREQHKSMALDIFDKRRNLLQKRYKRKLSIRFIDLRAEGKSGTRVIIHLPVL